MKYFNSDKINVYPAGFRSDEYKQSKLTTEENITHLQNFMSTSDGLYIDYIDYSKNHTSDNPSIAPPSIVQITNKNAGAYFYIVGTEAKVYINSKSEISVNNDYFILRVCGYSFRFKIIDFLNLCLDSSSLSGKDVYGYIYLRNTRSGPIGYVLGNVSTPSENVLDQGILFQGLGIGSNSEEGCNDCYKVKIGKFDSTNHFTISYDPIQVVNATADESGNNIKSTYGASIDSANGNTIILKNKNTVEISRTTLTNIEHADSALALDDPPSLSASKNNIIVTAGRRKSIPFTVPYAEKASEDESGDDIEETYGTSLSGSGATITLNNKNGGGLSSVTVDNVQNSNNSSYASKIKTSKAIGDVNNPVYVDSDGIIIAGSFIPKLNGNEQAAANPFYAPTSAGKVEQVLKSKGSGAPDWTDQSDLFVGKATKAIEDANGNTITSTYAHSLTATNATYTDDAKIYLKANDNDKAPKTLSYPSLNTVKNSFRSKIKNGSLSITKSSGVVNGYTIYTADFYGFKLSKGTFLTVYVANASSKNVSFKIKTGTGTNDFTTSDVYLNGQPCNDTNKLLANNYYNAYFTGTYWNFTPAETNLISGTSVTLNGNDKQGKYISIYAPTLPGTAGQVLKSKGSEAPEWINQESLVVNTASKADTIYVTTSEKPQNSGYKSIKSVTSLPESPDANTLYIVVEA